MVQTLRNPFLTEICSEHRQMRECIQAMRVAVECGEEHEWSDAAAAEALEALEALRDLTLRHFVREQEGGCFEEAIAVAPRHAARVIAIEREHATLLNELNALLLAAKSWGEAAATWQTIAPRVTRLVDAMTEHERTEDRLLAQVFNVAPDAA